MKYADSVVSLGGYELFIVFDDDRVYEITTLKPENTELKSLPPKFVYIKEFLEDHKRQPILAEAMADLDFSWATPFMMDVYKALVLIPFGITVSYKALAELSGHPKAARAVGSAMAKNRFLIVLPCHRVLAAGGKIGGFSGGLDMKYDLLRCEGHNEF